MTDTAIMTAFDKSIRSIYALHRHLLRDHPGASQANSACLNCVALHAATDIAKRDYEALVFGKPVTPKVPLAGADDLVFLKQQAD
jgi:hypothetical protein